MSFTGKGLRYWLPSYLWQSLLPKGKPDPNLPIHLFVCVVDHFEPFNSAADPNTALRRVKTWQKEYPKFASKHLDADGMPLQHTWFYPPHLDHKLLPYLVEICQAGYGEVEMHLHHNHMIPFPDNSETLRCKIMKCIEDYGKYGIFQQPVGPPRFAFIHGDWSLDNSGGKHICGVNDELSILRECGCYADFTFPCLNKSQPAMINTIYYAKGDKGKPKSYNYGMPARYGSTAPDNSLLMIQGIMGLRFDKKKKYKISIDYSDLDSNSLPTNDRAKFWIRNSISVKGQPNLRFIKLHTHGAVETKFAANFGKFAHETFSYIENNFNDRSRYFLHYLTSREMYNIIKYIESGCVKDLFSARNFELSPYLYNI